MISHYPDHTSTRDAETTLHASEELDRFFTLSLDMLCIVGFDGYFKRLNPSFAHTLGFIIDALLAEPFLSFVHPDDQAATSAKVEALAAGMDTIAFESRFRRQDGGYTWMLWNAAAVPERGLIYATAHDITERKRGEDELRATTARFAGVVESAMDAMISIDESQRILIFNAAAEQMFRCQAATAISQSIDQFVPLRFQRAHEQHIRAFSQTGTTSRSMHSLSMLSAVRADGQEFPIEATISQIVVAGQKIYTVIIRDITERKQAEEALRQKTTFVELLQEVAVAANQTTSIEQALQTAIDQVCMRIGWPVGHVYLSSDDQPCALVTTDIWHLADPERFTTFRAITEAIRCPSIDDLPGQVLISGTPEWITDLAAVPGAPRAKLICDLGVRAGFAFPVLVGAEVAAVLEFFATEPRERDVALLDVMAHVGAQLGRVIERARAESALRDSEERFRVLFRAFA